MAELIFESITGPITGEGAKWWELLDSEDVSGGRGPDTFVLGEGGSPYYVGGGNADYAVIEDLQNEDTIQLGTGDFTLSEDNTFLGDSGISILVGDDLVGFAVGASSEEVEGVIV